MHGPPGTGKSQTIANMIAEFIASGKSILFVSEKMAALEVVYNRLKAQGLDDFCLELHSHKANKREVVSELKRSLDEHLKARKGMTPEELERLKTRRNQLNVYVQSLHKKRTPIELTAYELFGRIAQLEEVPFLTSRYPDFDKLDQKKLFELEELVRRMSNAWAVVEQADEFPWKGCKENRFTPDTRSQWMALLDGCLETVYSLKEDTKRYALNLGLKAPGKMDDYERLDRLNKLITTTPRPPASWFENVDLSETKKLSEGYLKEWEKYWTKRHALEEQYDSRFLSITPGSADRVHADLKSVQKLLVKTRKGDGGLLQKSRELNYYLVDLPVRVDQWKTDSLKAMKLMDLKGDIKTPDRVRQIADLVKLCETSDRPERSWLDAWRLKEVKETLSKLKSDFTKKNELKSQLSDYTDEVLNLNHDELISWFESSGNSFMRYFMPSHYSNQSTIKSVSRSGTISETIVQDLKTAKALSTLQESLRSGEESARRDLGVYYTGDEPDFTASEKAIAVAENTIKLSGRARIPKILRDNLVAGQKPSKELLSLGSRLQDSINVWLKNTQQLKELIPSNKLPTSKKSIQKSNLTEVVEWSKEVKIRLASLGKTGSEALATRKGNHPLSYNELVGDLHKAEKLQVFEDDLNQRSDQHRTVFGGLYNGLLTDWKGILTAIEWTSRLLRTLPEGVPNALKNTVSEAGGALPLDPKIGVRLENLYKYMADINERFLKPIWSAPRSTDLALVEMKVEDLSEHIDELQTWVDYNKLHGEMVNDGLEGLLNQMERRRCTRSDLVKVLRKALYQGLLDRIYDEDPQLKAFRGQNHEQLIKDFQKLDRKFIRLNSQRVIDKANEQKPQGVFVQAPDSEITILMREAAKKRRHMPLRELFERIPVLIRKLKPCLMMSPISVSQFLKPTGIHFDLVVFDEASQIYTEDAVGAIYRGDQLVVAGDPKQLPPTPFFQYTVDDDFDWDADYEFDVFDSVLDECMGIGLPVKMLRWHYRSRHDSLISFSNDRFYDGQLVLFPASRMGADDLGLDFVYVKNGIYDRGKARNNVMEAEIVADLVFNHFTRYPDKTLGVVTFSISQMNTVHDAVESRLREHPEFESFFKEDRLNGFFVKNLENVQGDERDVMIFSVGYGYDEKGRITMNFGPLNKMGGERRLNVAITRAREKVVLVSSIKYDDIKLTSTQAQGVHSLYHYLRYAARRPRNLGEDDIDVVYASSLEMNVAEEVQRLGYKTVPSVGSSSFHVDIGVLDSEDPTRFIMGIMCDGETYQEANTARDRDRLRFQVLENLGWRIHRIWAPDWVQRRGTEMKRLEKALKQAERRRTKAVTKKPTAQPRLPLEKKMEKVKVEDAKSNDLPEVEPYRFSNPRPRYLFSRYSSEHKDRYLKQYHSEVRRLLPGVVRYEGPIHLDQAYRRLNKAFRLSRATKHFRDAYMD